MFEFAGQIVIGCVNGLDFCRFCQLIILKREVDRLWKATGAKALNGKWRRG